jgi:hypothetical protein
MAVFQLPGSNTIKTAETLRVKIEELKAKDFRQGMDEWPKT